MAQYRYTGPGPIEAVTPDGPAIVHPGDVWEFPEEPGYGPWEAIEAEGSEKPSAALPSTPPLQPPANEAENAPTGQPDAPSPKEA